MSTFRCTTLGMILFIKFSGGMGISYQGSVDLSVLPEDLYETVRTELSEKKLSKITKKNEDKNDLPAIDSVVYELRYEGSEKTFSVDESQASEEMLELIDDLRSYLVLTPKSKPLSN